MKNLDLNTAVFFRNEKVDFIYFETLFTSENWDGTFQDRIMVKIGGAMVNVDCSELYN